jgi:hypothetical protein
LTNEVTKLTNSVKGLEDLVGEKQSEIDGMQDRVRMAEEAMANEKTIFKSKLQVIESDFEEKEKYLKDSLKREMNQMVND